MLSLPTKINVMHKFIFILSVLIACSIRINATDIPNKQDKYEIRATWLTTIGGLDWPKTKATSPSSIKRQKDELCRQLDILKEAKFNTVIFQTRLRGDLIYPSKYETFAEALAGKTGKDPGYDVLDFAIKECHKRGMELHAWIVTIPIGNKRQVELLGRHSVVRKRPDLCKQFNGGWYLDPGNPGTADYLSAIVREIVEKYDVDGIHLDYIRYPERGEKFPDQNTFRKYGKKKKLEEWRRDNITYIVRRIYNDVKALKPWVKVSSSPVGKYRDTRRYSSRGWNAYMTVYQDAQAWLREGIQDAIFPMMYFKGNHFYPFALDWQENKGERWVVPGLGVYFLNPDEGNWPIDEVLRQIYFSRKNNLDGQAYFRNKFLIDNIKGLLDNIKMEFYNFNAVIPPMVWQDSIAPKSPGSLSLKKTGRNSSSDNGGRNGLKNNTTRDGCDSSEGIFNNTSKHTAADFIGNIDYNLVLEWDTLGTYKKGGVYFRIYGDNKYPVDTSKAENIVCPRVDGNSWVYSPQFPWEEKLFWSITTVDRYGNESTPVSAGILNFREKK